MPKIVMVNIGAHGHINPTIPVVGELVRRGAEVHYFAPDEFHSAIEAEGGIHESYDSLFGKVPPPTGGPMHELMALMPRLLTQECLHALPQIDGRLRALNPDLIVYDKFCLAARLLAKKQNLKAATFLPSYAANEHFNLGKLFGGSPPPPQALEHPAISQFRADAAQINQEFGVQWTGLHDLLGHSEALNICFVAKAFHYASETFDERFVFVGPSFGPRNASANWQSSEEDNRPLLFISLGTVFNTWPDFFRMCFEAFGGTVWRVVMAVGKNVQVSDLGKPPENFMVAPHFPQLEVLEKATAFVTHGGMNSAMESLWFGVPMVVIPQMREQAATAKRVAELGLGIALDRESIQIGSLRAAVEHIKCDAAIRDRVNAMKKEVRASGGQTKAAAALFEYANRH